MKSERFGARPKSGNESKTDNPILSRRRFMALSAAAAGSALLPGCGGGGDGAGGFVDGFYFGRTAFVNDVIGLAVKTGNLQVLVTDAEPNGHAEWFQGRIRGNSVDLMSTSGRARLRATFDGDRCAGTIDLPNDTSRAIAAELAGEGADIYDVHVSGGNFTGTSTQGHVLSASQQGKFVVGTLTENNGNQLPVNVMDLSQTYGYSIAGGQPDDYTVIISRNATLHYGRGGSVKTGSPGPNLIALDIQPSSSPTPGFFFGKVAFERDVIGIKVDPPNPQGGRRVRAYMSDSEPGGDLQWFTGVVSGSAVDLTSASGDGRLQGTLAADLIEGTVTLPGGRVRRFFALPAGEGAGIYDVTIDANGILVGTSEEGGRLHGHQVGLFVHLDITAPDGQVFESHPNDLTRAFSYPVPGNQPDTYVAIVAPRGRFVFGRSGNVRGGSAGLNIIGLDKKC
jgi:hypothetical protein